MVKNAALSIRISPELKEQLETLADNAGLSVAAYAERALKINMTPPNWVLADPELIHTLVNGPRVKLTIATGMPVALLTPEHAMQLGRQLMHASQVASATPTGSRSRIAACVDDVAQIARSEISKERRTISIMTRINKFLSDLDAHIKEWPHQDRGYYVSELEDALTTASTSVARSEPGVSDLLEKGIDHLHARRRR